MGEQIVQLGKKSGGATITGAGGGTYTWETDGEVLPVPWDVASELLAIQDADFYLADEPPAPGGGGEGASSEEDEAGGDGDGEDGDGEDVTEPAPAQAGEITEPAPKRPAAHGRRGKTG